MAFVAARRARLCLTFDNMGKAREIGAGLASAPDAQEPGLAVGYPRLLALLDELQLRATFFIEGWNAVHHPDRVTELARRGHEVALHGWVHERFATLAREEVERVVDRGLTAMRRLGLQPQGFRAPGGLRGPHAEAVLHAAGLRYDSSTDTPQEAEPEGAEPFAEPGRLPSGLVHVPWRYAMVDSVQYLRPRGRAPAPEALQARWCAVLDQLAAQRATTTLVLHAYVSGVEDARFAAARRVLTHARERGDIEICTALDLAQRVQPPAEETTP